MALWLQDMYLWLGFSPEAAKLHAHHFCWKPQLTSPGSKQCYLSQIFLLKKDIWMQCSIFIHI